MLIYFNKNKFRYNKGQLAPIFIAVLVILIIMAMVTVNLSKVAFIKTDSSNAVDAGALAAGSVMANTFNAVAQANSQMEASYWEFYATVSVLFVIAIASLAVAMTMACTPPLGACLAVGAIGVFRGATMAIGVAVTAFSLAQYFFYLSMRKMAKKGRESAIEIGHKFTFINSGIGSKLKEGSPPESIGEGEKRNNYREMFSQFLAGIGDAQEYTYPWQDGQDRGHFVYSKITIDEVDTFKLTVTLLPSPAITALLLASGILAFKAKPLLTTACTCQIAAASCCPNPKLGACCAEAVACWEEACAAAEALMAPIFPLMAAAWAGLLPGGTITSKDGFDTLLFIISWIDDIEHNRLVRADTTQHHEGADLGLWQTRYPDTQSYSIVDFRGRGEIYPPELRHDASIIETDR